MVAIAFDPDAYAGAPGRRSLNWTANLANSRAGQFGLLLVVAFALRAANLGDWNYEVDDQFFALVGQRIFAGDVLYADLFDRKGPALYLVFAILAVFGKSVVPYQLFATLCTALGAFGIARIAALLTGGRGALIAGGIYIAMMAAFGGANAQTPVFYNPLMIGCAWAVATRLDLLRQGRIDGRILAGFACAGLAIAFKMSAGIEGAFLGLFAMALVLRSSAPLKRKMAIGALLAALGLLPMALAALWFAATGHFDAFWQAVVASNFDRTYPVASNRLWRIKMFAFKLLPLCVFALFGLLSLSRRKELGLAAGFAFGWALAAIGAVLVFPTIYTHYLLPVLPPLCVLGAASFRHWRTGAPLAIALATVFVWLSGEIDLAARERSREESAELVDYVRAQTPGHRLIVWGFPTYLYVLADAKPPSALAFPPHFFDDYEKGASGLDEMAELRRMLSLRPEAFVVQRPLPAQPLNRETVAAMESFLKTCRTRRRFTMRDHTGPQVQVVYSQCGGA